MHVAEVRELSDQELEQELDNAHKELMNLRFRLATKQLTDTTQLGIVKRKIARIKTVIRERELQRIGR